MLQIIHHEQAETERLPVGAIAETYLFCVQITDVQPYAKALIEEITDTSWISKLDFVGKMSYELTANKTIERLVELFKTVQDVVTGDFGEFMISLSSGKCLQTKHSHTCLPISELWKEKLSNNPGFDFHTLNPIEKFSFGESKFTRTGNSYPAAAEQVHRFSRNGKDVMDSVHLEHFGSPLALKNLSEGKKGYVVSFSINSQDYRKILNNALSNEDIQALTKLCDELYIIGVKV